MSRILPDALCPDRNLPAEADVVIIGGGIIGASAAFYLARAGLQVVLCEKGLIGAEQSARNWGWVRQMGRDQAEIPLAMRSLELWRGLNAAVGAETGFRQTGIAYLCRNEREMQEYRTWTQRARRWNIDTRLLNHAGAKALLPGLQEAFVGGMHTASDGRAEPLLATPAIARAAQKAGASIHSVCAVRGIDRAAGAVSGVITEKGVIRTRQVVLAGGAWSSTLARSLGLSLPVLKVLGSAARIELDADLPDMPVGGADFAFRRRIDGSYTISMRNGNLVPIVPDSFRYFKEFAPKYGSYWRELKLRAGPMFLQEAAIPASWPTDRETIFERSRILDPDPKRAWVMKGIAIATRAFPQLASARVTHVWGGLMDTTPDAIPVIGPVDQLPGLFMANGFSGHGFGIGPGSGELIAEMLTGRVPTVDPAPFRFDRFTHKAA